MSDDGIVIEESPGAVEATAEAEGEGGAPPTMDSVRALLARRDDLEENMAALTAYLEASPVGIHGSVIDREGYPRADIDVAAILSARNELARM